MQVTTPLQLSTSPFVKVYTLEEFWELPDPPDLFYLSNESIARFRGRPRSSAVK